MTIRARNLSSGQNDHHADRGEAGADEIGIAEELFHFGMC